MILKYFQPRGGGRKEEGGREGGKDNEIASLTGSKDFLGKKNTEGVGL